MENLPGKKIRWKEPEVNEIITIDRKTRGGGGEPPLDSTGTGPS